MYEFFPGSHITNLFHPSGVGRWGSSAGNFPTHPPPRKISAIQLMPRFVARAPRMFSRTCAVLRWIEENINIKIFLLFFRVPGRSDRASRWVRQRCGLHALINGVSATRKDGFNYLMIFFFALFFPNSLKIFLLPPDTRLIYYMRYMTVFVVL